MNVPYIHLGNYKVDDELVQYLLPEDYGRFYTSYESENPPDDILNDFYEKIVEKIMKEIGLFYNCKYEYYYWLQAYNGPVHGHAAHHHCQVLQPPGIYDALSFCHFIRTQNKPFQFVDKQGNYQIPPEQDEGDIIAFPIWAWHEARPHGIKDYERITIAGNITLTQVDSIDAYTKTIR